MPRTVDSRPLGAATVPPNSASVGFFTKRPGFACAPATAYDYGRRERNAGAANNDEEVGVGGLGSLWFSKCGPWLLLASLGCLGACSEFVAPAARATDPLAQQAAKDDMEARAERVFVYESRIADALLDRYPLREDFLAASPALIVAEADLTTACGALTRAVLRHLEGREQSLKQKLKVASSLAGCERAARRVEAMLDLPPNNDLVATGGP